MNTMPLESVIIPVYMAEPYIRKCLESVITQTYENLQIIVVDDGSPDKSMEIVEELANKDGRIEMYRKMRGVSSARNLGICKSKGEYIHFLDSDDYVESNAYKVLMDIAKKRTCRYC